MSEGNWMMTYSGIEFRLLDSDPELVRIGDIAHHLSNICRYTGACKHHFSVAQHSVLVSSQVVGKGHELWGLLHDAAEAYLSDVSAPAKDMFPEVERAEEDILKVIIGKFGLPWPMPDEVKRADAAVTAFEWGVLMKGSVGITRYSEVKPAQVPVIKMTPEQAERWFLLRFNYLYDGSNEKDY